jgi:hypothetical protein
MCRSPQRSPELSRLRIERRCDCERSTKESIAFGRFEDGSDVGPIGFLLDHFTQSPPDIFCLQESSMTFAVNLVKLLRVRFKRPYSMHHASSPPEGIACIFNKAIFPDLVDITRGSRAGACDVTGRAFQCLYSASLELMIINIHAPNPASTKDCDRVRHLGDMRASTRSVLQAWLDREQYYSFDFVGPCTRPKRIIACGDYNDSSQVYLTFPNSSYTTEEAYIKSESIGGGKGLYVMGKQLRASNSANSPISCCAYSLDKPTRVAGDYIMVSLDVNADNPTTIGKLPHFMREYRNRHFSDTVDGPGVNKAFAATAHGREVSAGCMTSAELDMLTDMFGKENIMLASHMIHDHPDTFAELEGGDVRWLYSDHLAVQRRVVIGEDIARIVTLNVSFHLTTPQLFSRTYPSERAMTVLAYLNWMRQKKANESETTQSSAPSVYIYVQK